jgi:hypothetical protein
VSNSQLRSDFRRSVVADTKKRNGGGGRRRYFESMRLDKDSQTPMLFIAGQYIDPKPAQEIIRYDPQTRQPLPVILPYKKYRKHTRMVVGKTGKQYPVDEICSAGYDDYNPQPCAGCAAADAGDKSIKLGDAFGLGFVDMSYYHGHPMQDRDDPNKFAQKQDHSLVIVFDKCEGRACNFCRVLQGYQPVLEQGETWPPYPPGSITTTFGRRRFLDLGRNHLQDILSWDTILGKLCGACRSELVVDGFTCAFCNHMVIDLQQDARTNQQIQQVIQHPVACPNCRMESILQEASFCDNCEAQNKGTTHIGIFSNIVVFGTKQGEGTGSHLVLGPRQFATLEEIGRTVDPGFLQGKPFLQYISEIAQPYDFDEMMQPRPLADQAKSLQLQPRQGPPQGQAYGSYGQPPQQGGYPPPQQQYGGAPPMQYQQPPQNGYAPGAPAPGPGNFVPPGRPNFGR